LGVAKTEFSHYFFDVDGTDEDMLITLGYYILGLYERLPKELQQETEGFDAQIKSNIMTTSAILEQREEKRGKKIDEKIGKKRGMLFTKRIVQIELILKGLTQNPNLDIPTIKLITGQTATDIKAIQKSFERNDLEKTRQFISGKFKDFGALTELEVAEIEKLLNEFLPKFKKKKSAKQQ
jgi:hypothetical protein